jgi:hypothetical protein
LGKTKSGIVVGNSISEYQLGLDRLSFTAPGEEALRAAGVRTQDVERFIHAGNCYVAFWDPDNIQLEDRLP